VFERVNAHTIAGSQQDHFISHRDAGDAGDIDQRQVHRNAAYDRGIVFADDDATAVRELSVVAVGVANG